MTLAPGVGIAIAVPVRNEADRLPRLLAALAEQKEAPPFALCLFFDDCTDRSEAIVEALAPSLPFAIVSDGSADGASANAGRARRAACAVALVTVPDGVLLTTDADSAPAPTWIAANLAGLRHADLVAGLIRREGEVSPWQDAVEDYYGRLHHLRRTCDPVPWEAPKTHHWTSGASLAMTTPVYSALGGFAPIASGEDAALGDAASRAGWRVRRDAAATVRTSSRRDGRAEHGFAAALAALDGSAPPPLVSHPDDEAWRFRLQAAARQRHGSGDYRALAGMLDLPLAEVEQVAGECRNGEAFAARIVGAPPGGMRQVPVDRAAMLLALHEARLAGAA